MTQDVSHRIAIELERSSADQGGMMVCFGNSHGGYALEIIDNRLVYTYNYAGLDTTRLVSDREVPLGQTALAFEFSKTGALGGTGRLLIDDKPVGESVFAHTLLRLSLAPLTFGYASSQPVDPQRHESPPFAGRIVRVDYKIGNDRERFPNTLDVD